MRKLSHRFIFRYFSSDGTIGESAGHVNFDVVADDVFDDLDGQIIAREDSSETEPKEAVPLKGETPPPRRKLIRKMTKVTREIKEVTRDLKEDGKDWVNKHIRRKDSRDEGEGTSSEEERDDHPSELKNGIKDAK